MLPSGVNPVGTVYPVKVSELRKFLNIQRQIGVPAMAQYPTMFLTFAMNVGPDRSSRMSRALASSAIPI